MTSRHVLFTTAFVLLIALSVLPPVLEWSNRVEPRILGLSFAIAWQLMIAVLMSATLIAWYFVDAATGDLDIGADIPAVADEQIGGELP